MLLTCLDLLQIHILLQLTRTLEMEQMSELPYNNREQMQTYFHPVVEFVLHLAFHPTTINSNNKSETDIIYCFCKTTEDVGNSFTVKNQSAFNSGFI